MNKKIVIPIVIIFLAITGYFFMTQLGSQRPDDVSAVLYQPPGGYYILHADNDGAGESLAGISRTLLDYMRENPDKQQIGIRFSRQNAPENYILVDLGEDVIEERTTSSSGTKTRTVWPGRAKERLEWATANGTFTVDGFPPPKHSNLYH